jgi:hypothetical protein
LANVPIGVQVAAVVDTNGAGDSFATAHVIATMWSFPDAGAAANWAGGMAVSQSQSCKPACLTGAIKQNLAQFLSKIITQSETTSALPQVWQSRSRHVDILKWSTLSKKLQELMVALSGSST